MIIAFLDVFYKSTGARAACVLADAWEAETPSSSYVHDVDTVAAYEPGNFYRRELPSLLAVLGLLPSLPDIVVVDGYVWLPPGDRPGLGARMYEALGRRPSVVGIAKSAFAGIGSSTGIIRVTRGTSRNPLFITAAGMEPEIAARCVRSMAGKNRIPAMVKMADHLARNGVLSAYADWPADQ